MALHERAWSGLNILVFGKKSLLPMEIEQAIASASPHNEVRIESFEEFEDAYDFCKEKRSIGYIFLLENCGKLPPKDVFMQLAKPYEQKGWPVFGTLIHEGTPSLTGYRVLKECPHLLDYRAATDFTDKNKTASTLGEVWNQFISAFETSVIPEPLQKTFLSLTEKALPQESLHFLDRVGVLLCQNLNVSWIEMVALKWNPVLNVLGKEQPFALKPHTTLSQICAFANAASVENTDLQKVIQSKNPLCARINTVLQILETERQKGSLTEFLMNLGREAKPGSPALLRQIVRSRDHILKIATEEAQTTKWSETA